MRAGDRAHLARRATWPMFPPAPLLPSFGPLGQGNESGMMTEQVVQWDPLRRGRAVPFMSARRRADDIPPSAHGLGEVRELVVHDHHRPRREIRRDRFGGLSDKILRIIARYLCQLHLKLTER
jgi:hypothetical protein